MIKEEMKIITLGDIFKNIETEEKAFKFLNYIKELQQENQQLKKQKRDVVEVLYQLKRSARWERHLYEVDYMLRMLGETDE